MNDPQLRDFRYCVLVEETKDKAFQIYEFETRSSDIYFEQVLYICWYLGKAETKPASIKTVININFKRGYTTYNRYNW